MAGRKGTTQTPAPSDLDAQNVGVQTIPLDGDPRTPANSRGFREDAPVEDLEGDVSTEPLAGTEPTDGRESDELGDGTEPLDGIEPQRVAAAPEPEETNEPADTTPAVPAASTTPAPAAAAPVPAASPVVTDEALIELADIIGSDAVEKVIKPLIVKAQLADKLQAQIASNEQSQYETAVNASIDSIGSPRYSNPEDRKLLRSTAEVIYQGAMRAGQPIDGHEALRRAHALMPPAKNQTPARGAKTVMVNGTRHRSMANTVPSRTTPTAPPTKRSYAAAIAAIDKKLNDLQGG